jgi:hypothetical protein
MNRQEANDTRVLSFATASRVAFECECDDEECRRSLLMSPRAFIARRETGEPIVYADHFQAADEPTRAECAFVTEADAAPHIAFPGALLSR